MSVFSSEGNQGVEIDYEVHWLSSWGDKSLKFQIKVQGDEKFNRNLS